MAAKKKSAKKRKVERKTDDIQRELSRRGKYLDELGLFRDGNKWSKKLAFTPMAYEQYSYTGYKGAMSFTASKAKERLDRYTSTRNSGSGRHTVRWLQTIGVEPYVIAVSSHSSYADIYEILDNGLDNYQLAMALRDWYMDNFDKELDHHRHADWYMVAIE